MQEGILDSLMFILSRYFRSYSSYLRNETPATDSGEKEEPFSSFKQGGNAFFHAKLAANCCVALGKAHCAAVHTEGDLLLMSAYSRGSVPGGTAARADALRGPASHEGDDPGRSDGRGPA